MVTDNPEKPCSRDVPEVQEQPRILTPPFPVELLNGDKLPPKTKVRYGLVWPAVAADWVIELRCFRQQFGTPEQLPKEEHFKNAAKMFFNPKTEHFIWHVWAEDMLHECCHEKFVGFAGSGSSGKCLAPETPVLRFDGTVCRADEVKVGDELMGPDSKPRRVLRAGPGRSNMVRIVPVKGDPWVCNDDHILTLKRAWATKKCWRRVGDIIDISVKDYLSRSSSFQEQHSLFCVGVDFPERPVEIDPRAYGIWLGDGSTGHPAITYPEDTESEVHEYLVSYFTSEGYSVRRANYGKHCGTLYVKRGWRDNPFLRLVRESSGNPPSSAPYKGQKRILDRYLRNNRATRMELLAGIIDADGYANGTYFEVCSSNPGLTQDIAFLARSLGFRVTVTHRTTKCGGKFFPSARINIIGDTHLIPTLRKKCTLKKLRQNADCTSFKVEQLGEGDWYGFTLDGDGRFLLGDFTVTHNSEFMAIWALLNWLSGPFMTLSLVTSTSIRDAKKRVWGSIQRYWPAMKPVAPGKLIDTPTPSIIAIRGDTRLEQAGVYLIPAEAKKTNEVTGKMRGMKAGRVIVVGDELSELGHAFLDTALSNLSNNPEFHMSGAANPVSYYDPFGRFVEPVNGWGSISVEDYKWRTKLGGVCLHFDAYKNPNYLARENLWPIQKWEKIEEAVERLGEDNPLFWRDYRGFWPPQAISNAIYSEAEIIRFKADQKPVWRGATQRVAGIDPSFVSGGDRCVLYLGTYGLNADGSEQVSFDKFHYIDDEASNPEPRTFQIARAIQKIITEEKVPWRNVGVDVTGGGVPFCDALATVCGSNEFLRVHFGGAPSARSLSAYDATKAEDKFVNRVTELWFGAKEFLQNGQLRGIGPDLAKEMTSRHYETRKSGTMKVRVEPKSDMKARIGRSPDIADAAFVLLDVVRERFGMRPPQEGGGKPGRQGWSSWKKTLTTKFAPRRTPQLLSMG
jgi:hypothetical protein